MEASFINHRPAITNRPFASEADWWAIRRLLIETFPVTGPGFNWEIRHWDGNRYHRAETWSPEQYQHFRVWETADGRLVGLAHPDGNEFFLELHPDYRFLEEEMTAWSEEHFSTPLADGSREIFMCVYDYDIPRRRILEKRGYVPTSYGWVTRRGRFGADPGSLDWLVAEPRVADGYCLRATQIDDEADSRRMAALLNAAFGRDFHQPNEYWNFIHNSPSFNNDLNLVAEAPDGTFAAHAGLTLDADNHFAVFEPVCTHPEHRRKGLAQALMLEGLRRVKALGAVEIEVSTGNAEAANGLYDSLGFSEYYRASYWRKQLP